MHINLEELKISIQQSFEKSRPAYGQDLVLVVGKTGAGKSTLANHLLKYPLKKGKGGKAIPVDSKIPAPAEMGDNIQSVTTYPTAYATDQGISIADCPGFQDNRGPEARICVSLCTESVVQHSKSIPGIMTVIDWNTIDSARAEGLREVTLTLGNLFQQGFDISDSILFVITRANFSEGIDHEYLMEKIKQLHDSLAKKLKEEQKKLESAAEKNAVMLAESTDASSSSEVNEIILKLSILSIMKKNPQNNILADVFDHGETRKQIFFALKRIKPIPKQAFDFKHADGARLHFQDLITEEMVQLKGKIDKLHAMPAEIQQLQEEQQTREQDVTNDHKQIKEIKEGRKFQGEKDPIIIQERAKLAATEQRIRDARNELDEQKKIAKALNRELQQFDSSDEMIFWSSDRKEYRGDRIGDWAGKTVGGIATGGLDTVFDPLNKADGFVSGAAGTLWATVSYLPAMYATAAGMLLGGATAAIAGIISKIDLDFIYDRKGLPFSRVEESHRNGVFKRIQCSPENGIYEAKYTSDRGRTAVAAVTIFGRKRDWKDNKTMISQLNRDIEASDSKVQELEREIQDRHMENVERRFAIDRMLKNAELDSKAAKDELEKSIRTTQKYIDELAQKILERQTLQTDCAQGLTQQMPFLALIEEMCLFMDFNTENYPTIVTDFQDAYLALQQTLYLHQFPEPKLKSIPAVQTKPAAADTLFGFDNELPEAEVTADQPLQIEETSHSVATSSGVLPLPKFSPSLEEQSLPYEELLKTQPTLVHPVASLVTVLEQATQELALSADSSSESAILANLISRLDAHEQQLFDTNMQISKQRELVDQQCEQQAELTNQVKRLEKEKQWLTKNAAQNSGQIASLESQINQLTTNLTVLTIDYKQNQRILEDKRYLQSKPELSGYYNQLKLKLNQLFLKCMLINIGFKTAETSTAEKVAQGITLLGDTFPIVPGVSLITRGIEWIVGHVQDSQQKKQAKQGIELASSISEMEQNSEMIARVLTLAYEAQLIQLTKDSRLQLAEWTVKPLWLALISDKLNFHEQYFVAYFFQLVIPDINIDVSSEFKKIKKDFERPLQLFLQDSRKWVAKDFYTKPGIKFYEKETGYLAAGKACNVREYHYRLGTRQEAERFGWSIAKSADAKNPDTLTEKVERFESMFEQRVNKVQQAAAVDKFEAAAQMLALQRQHQQMADEIARLRKEKGAEKSPSPKQSKSSVTSSQATLFALNKYPSLTSLASQKTIRSDFVVEAAVMDFTGKRSGFLNCKEGDEFYILDDTQDDRVLVESIRAKQKGYLPKDCFLLEQDYDYSPM